MRGEQRRLSLVWASFNVGGISEFGVVVAVVVCVVWIVFFHGILVSIRFIDGIV